MRIALSHYTMSSSPTLRTLH